MDVEPTVPVLVLDGQVPGGHHLIPPRSQEPEPMDHELEGEGLPPDRKSAPADEEPVTQKSKTVKKTNTKEKYVKPEPKPKVKFYDDEPFEEEELPEPEPTGSQVHPRERSRSRDCSRSPGAQRQNPRMRN